MWTYINLFTAVFALIGFIMATRNMWKATDRIQELYQKQPEDEWIDEALKEIAYTGLINAYAKEIHANRMYAIVQFICFVIATVLFFNSL